MIAIVWQFDVKSGRETEFEELYGADGEWTSMNRLTRSYLGTSFLRDQSRSSAICDYIGEMPYEQHWPTVPMPWPCSKNAARR